MFSPSHPLPIFSLKSSSMKIKSLVHTLIVSHVCRIIRALSKLKGAIAEILKENHSNNIYSSSYKKKHGSKISKKIIMGSFRFHYNWSSSRRSSHVIPVPSRVYEGLRPVEQQQEGGGGGGEQNCFHDSELAGYLEWLEENVHSEKVNEMNDVDMLAEMFIANCHEKFRLEKQESDRKLQEMLARSM